MFVTWAITLNEKIEHRKMRNKLIQMSSRFSEETNLGRHLASILKILCICANVPTQTWVDT